MNVGELLSALHNVASDVDLWIEIEFMEGGVEGSLVGPVQMVDIGTGSDECGEGVWLRCQA